MTTIGILGLDTSHGEAFAEALTRGGVATNRQEPIDVAVWDGGTVRDDEYVDEFCAEFGATRYEDPTEMVEAVDGAMVLSVDWERHVELARPFLESGVPTLVDKPLVGSQSQLTSLASAASDAPLFGGSALPYHPSFAALPETAGRRTLHLAGYHDHFYYRVHVVDTARAIVASDWTEVAPLQATAASGVAVSFDDGTWATLRFDGPTDDGVFAALDVADRTRTVAVEATEAALQEMYDPYLETFLGIVDGTVESPARSVLDAARLLLAAEAALAVDRPVTPADPILEAYESTSASFLEGYEPYY